RMPVASALVASLHHLLAFTLVALLVFEHALFAPTLPVALARKLARVDLYYGIVAGVLLIVGGLRVFYFEKGAAYYFHDGWFIAKLSLFLLMGLASIYPTVVFLSWRPALRAGQAPQIAAQQARLVRVCLRLELTTVLGILLAAPLMARGIGYFGQ